MDTHERELLLHNPLLRRVVRAMQRGLKVDAAVDAELSLALDEPDLTNEQLLKLERAINTALGRLPPTATKKLFAGTLEVKELADFFSLTVAQLARTSLASDEAKALELQHLWGW